MTSVVAEAEGGEIGAVDEVDDSDELSIDVEMLLDILKEPSGGSSQEPQLSGSEHGNVEGGDAAGGLLNFQIHRGLEDPDVSVVEPIMFRGSGDLDYGNLSFVDRSCGGQSLMSLNDCEKDRVSVLQPDMAHSSTTPSFQDGSFDFFSGQAVYTDGSQGLDTNFTYGDFAFTGKSTVASADQHTNGCDIYNISGGCGEFSGDFVSMQSATSADDTQVFHPPLYSFLLDDDYGIKYGDGVCANSEKDEIKPIYPKSASIASNSLLVDQSDQKGHGLESEDRGHMSSVNGHIPFAYYHPDQYKEQHFGSMEEDIDTKDAHKNMIWHDNELTSEVVHSISDSRNLLSGTSAALPTQKYTLAVQDSKAVCAAYRESQLGEGAAKFPMNYSNPTSHLRSKELFKGVMPEYEHKPAMVISPYPSTVSPESIQSNSSSSKSYVDNDPDVCIVEDISRSTGHYSSPAFEKTIVPQQTAHCSDQYHTGVGSTKFRPMDERFVFRVALQDLSQPKSEATPPDGLLAVPLLRHQRIALSWMVQKETSSLYCSGGILADDQGLGKTVSTIALLLKERPPALRVDNQVIKKEEFETLDLDDDDDDVTVVGGKRQKSDDCQVMSYRKMMRERDSCGKSKGRPSCGTLVVCPTSVLRQWADELHKKVTREANLSVLVYHGGNRTRDPLELAKYDVVLTTYSIVSMEVPKQPVVDEEADEKARIKSEDAHFFELSFGKKRKYPPGGKKGSKTKKGTSDAMLESTARPLAKVAWFRVVLDEAQSIKNHRTQVARACWGLRAKRRWCLSGTPIQNAIDDLYSYFRFLRYEPYAVYKSFISTIKIPIQKSPTKGYKKLQAVLKTIMLRRTKGTLLDGEPIINLPPKFIELKKVDFTDEERDFYTTLESDSRAQFQEYADAGTVKQNYVNILLMLLRLRQACDHPLLVGGVGSDSIAKYSVEMAKKLPREQQVHLQNCLEGSLAICGICNDPPEDAVVTVCGHVFCNQCICEHLAGDDNQCPISRCKMKLNVSSVFSKATLSSCLSEQPGGPESEPAKSRENHPARRSPDSSKIRAALEVLKSLSKPEVHAPRDKCSEKYSVEGGCSHESTSMNSQSDHVDKTVEENSNQPKTVFGEKAIVFSQWTRMLDLVEACLRSSSIQYRRLDGTMSVTARDKAVKDFNTLPEVSVMIMSLKAASLGLNMVAACHVLLLDLWWNPTTEDQAIDRAHRIGQTRPVKVLRLTVRDTVEDRILLLQKKKREMVASAFGEDETGGRQSRLTVEDLKYLFMA